MEALRRSPRDAEDVAVPDRTDAGARPLPRRAAQAHLLAGWLRSRLRHPVALEHEPAKRLEGVEVDGRPAPFPPGDPPDPSDLLSDELDIFGRDRVYEDAVRAAGAVGSSGGRRSGSPGE